MKKFTFFTILLSLLKIIRSTPFSARNWLRDLEKDGYDISIPPGALHGQPTIVNVTMYVESIGNFQPLKMEYEIDMYLSQYWVDARLIHNQVYCIHLTVGNDLDRVWQPDLYFANSKEARLNAVTVPNHSFQICHYGWVKYSVRISARMQCQMNLRRFPFDKQLCTVKILPFSNNTTRLQIHWSQGDAIVINSELLDADLRLKKYEANFCDGKYFTGNYSCLLAKFFFERTIGQSMLQIYCPSFTIVCISWISFWIDPTSVPGRVGLAVTTLLTLATQTAGIAFTMPSVGYAKALDIWLSICLLFLFGSLVEFTLVNMYTRRWQSLTRKEIGMIKKFPLMTLGETDYEVIRKGMCEKYRERAKTIDKVSRGLFPALFCVFLFIYFIVFTT